jgi:hypothetical protein
MIVSIKKTVICFFFITYCFGQETDMERVEYTDIAQVNSENSINLFRAFVNLPISLAWKGSYLIPGIEYRKFQPNWSFSLGTPKTKHKYFLSKKHTIQAFATFDGFFSNIQEKRAVTYSISATAIADNKSITKVLDGLG